MTNLKGVTVAAKLREAHEAGEDPQQEKIFELAQEIISLRKHITFLEKQIVDLEQQLGDALLRN